MNLFFFFVRTKHFVHSFLLFSFFFIARVLYRFFFGNIEFTFNYYIELLVLF